jgi:transcription-repair coupling factor (superfamily II helicase)
VPGDAHLPKDYVTAEDARLEAYRRLAAVSSDADVEDIGAEWADRYGPLPGAAARDCWPWPACGRPPWRGAFARSP